MPGTMTKTDIYQELKQEHEQIRQMFQQLQQEGADRQRIFAGLQSDLTAHMRAEEQTLYARLKPEEPAHEHVLHGIEEHHVADLLLKELAKNEAGTDRWLAKVGVLETSVEHHVQDEEKELFKAAKKVLKGDEPMQLTSEFESAKQRNMK